jgi:hypothetical protein
MKKINVIIISFLIFFNNNSFSNLYTQINNNIVVKIGELLVTSIDIENQIITNLIINKQEITQENIDKNKNFAVKTLINKSIKLGEINKYQIKDYNKKDLQDYSKNIAKNLNANENSLRQIFKQYNIDYDSFLKNYEIELLWNTLIFQLYKNQINVNILEVENEVEKISKNKNLEELKIIKENILSQKKKDKLNLFSRSHFTNLENTVSINFQ